MAIFFIGKIAFGNILILLVKKSNYRQKKTYAQVDKKSDFQLDLNLLASQ